MTNTKHYARPNGEFIATYHGGGEPDGEFVEIPDSPPIDGSQIYLFPGWSEFVPVETSETTEQKLQRLLREVGELQKEIGKT